MLEFKPFTKIGRWSREVIVTEKIDGTNASIYIDKDGTFLTGSRNRWITPQDDNFGFSKWAHENKDELLRLGPGHHFGEWFGKGIQRNYGLNEKRFALFNVIRHEASRPACCHLVPVLWRGNANDLKIDQIMEHLKLFGSQAVPYMNPEGIVLFFTHNNAIFKKTFESDVEGKGNK